MFLTEGGGYRYASTLPLTSAVDGGGWSTPRPDDLYTGKSRYPLYRRLDGLQDRSRRVRKISPSPGFHSRTVQPEASRYTNWAIQAHHKEILMWNKLSFITFLNKIGNGRVTHVKLRRFRLTFAAVEKRVTITFCVCVCSCSYPACNAHAPYWHLWPAPLYNIFPHYAINGTIFEKKNINIFLFIWSAKFV
jgi:hypothetical protein